MTTSTLRATGGAVMLTIPRKVLDVTGMGVGTVLEIKTQGDSLMLTPVTKPKYRLDELLAQCDDDSFTLKSEFLDAPAAGDEAL